MHWAPIPIAEFVLPSTANLTVTDAEVFRLLSRVARRGFWISAVAMIVSLALAIVAGFTENVFASFTFITIGFGAGVGNLLIRHKLNVALWVSREPAAVYWAEPKPIVRQLILSSSTTNLLTLHTPAPVKLEAMLGYNDMISILLWLRHRNPDALIGSYTPSDSDGRLLGNDPWSPPSTTSVTKQ